MNKNNSIFILLLVGPSIIIYLLSLMDTTTLLDDLAAALTLASITLCPFIGAIIFKYKISIYLALSIPLVLTVTKALNFDGAERLVAVGFIIFFGASIISCALGCLIKSLYKKYTYAKNI